MVIFLLLFIDFFETAGTLVAIGQEVGLINKDGPLEKVEQTFLADSLGTCVGAILDVSTVTSFVESSTDVGVGGRTGLTALIIVGVMMAQQMKTIEWDDLLIAFYLRNRPSFSICSFSLDSNGLLFSS